jgi:hypothetical protein
LSLTSAQDIINQALRFSGELTDVTPSDYQSEYRQSALDYLNRFYLAILSGGNEFDVEMAEPFSWAISPQPGVFKVEPAINVNVTIAHNATSGTFGAIPQDAFGNNVSLAGRHLRVDNLSDVYRIVTHTSGSTAFTIDFAYIQPDQNGTGATAYKLDYTLTQSAGILRLTTPMRLFQIQSKIYDGEIVGSNMAAMRREFPIAFLQTRYPDRFSIKSQDSTAKSMVISINTNPLDNARVEYDFIPFPTPLTDSSSSFPVVPLQHLMVLAYGVAYYILQNKKDDRAQTYFQLASTGLISMVKAEKKQRVDTNRERGRLVPRQDLLKRRGVPWWWGRW